MRHAGAMVAMIMWAGLTWADDWPGYRGPHRNDVSAEKGLLKEWPVGGHPRWYRMAGSTFAIRSCCFATMFRENDG